jgi:pilus assembly protein CpaF
MGVYDAPPPGSAFNFQPDTLDTPLPPTAPVSPAVAAALGIATTIEISPEARTLAREVRRRADEAVSAVRVEGRSVSEEDKSRIQRELIAVLLPGTGIPTEQVVAAIEEASAGLFGIERYLDDKDVSDIMINAHDSIFIERAGRLEQIMEPLLSSAIDLSQLCDRIISRCGNRDGLTREQPRFDSRFTRATPWGEINIRVNITDRSITVAGEPTISLRKPTASGFDRIEPWTEGALAPLPPDAAFLLREAFRRRASVLLVGGTGSGKTSLLKALLRSIADLGERVVVVEEANELDLRTELSNYVGLISSKDAKIADLIANAMRMRPDRVVVGECREPEEVMSFLRAVNTGHAGSITTVHASSAKDGMQAMLTLAASSETKSSTEHVGSLISRGLDLVVFLGSQYQRDAAGDRRRVRRVLEICAVGEFSNANSVPDFHLVPLYLRAEDRPYAVVEFDRPLSSRGYGSISDHGAHFIDRMRATGATEEELRSWLAPRTELPPVGRL